MSKRNFESQDDERPSKFRLQSEYGSVVADHYNGIKETGLKIRDSSCIYYLRNYNNWIKSFLLAKYIDLIRDQSADEHKIIALDVGCGKGGDLMKWQKGRIHHLICADIASASVDICRERYEVMKQKGRIFSVEFIKADCSKVKLKKLNAQPEMKIDIVSCQFAIHYAFETLSQAETLIQNISENLKKGGYFIATLPDGSIIQALLDAKKSNKIGNDVFKIEFPESRPKKPDLFGDIFNFFLEGAVNCPEFLVHFDTLERICEKYGLETVYRKSFGDIYEEGIRNRDAKSLLFKMKALQAYHSSKGDNSSASDLNPKEYLHAEEYLEKNNVSSVKTISISEWETICLYQAVAFKKVK